MELVIWPVPALLQQLKHLDEALTTPKPLTAAMPPNDKAGRVVFIGNIPYGKRPWRQRKGAPWLL